MSDAKAIPEGFSAVTAYIVVENANEALKFYEKAFSATSDYVMRSPDGSKVFHAELTIGNGKVMLGDAFPEMDVHGPEKGKRPPVSLHVYAEDADGLFDQAVAAGATVVRPMEDQVYGERMGQLVDPYGHYWSIGKHIEDVSVEEATRRITEAMKDC